MPEDEYFTPFKDLRFNGEAIIIYHEPNAHTDGDSVVLFRGSDVVSTGDIFTPEGYPLIDLQRGGSIEGEISALNHILDLTVPGKTQDGGTYVIPGHGRICDEADVVEFRDMVVIIRDRIKEMIKRRMTLDQVKAAKPSRDYDTEYISENSFVKADQFVEAIYKSLTQVKRGREHEMKRLVSCSALFTLATSGGIHAQGVSAAVPTSGKAAAPVDLTGYWVSVVTEDWRWRMVTPLKGDAASIPINAEARKIVDAWDPAKDEAAGLQCKAYGAPGLMRIPGRLHIAWQDDNTLKIETDAGTQTRLFHFGRQPPAHAAGSWQGYSAAHWQSRHKTGLVDWDWRAGLEPRAAWK